MIRYFILLVALVINAQLFAQKAPMKYGKIAAEDIALKVYEADTSAAAVILGDFAELNFDIGPEGLQYQFSLHKRIKIFKRSSFDEGDISIEYHSRNHDLGRVKAQVITPSGEEIELSRKEMFDEKVVGNWMRKKFSLPNLEEVEKNKFGDCKALTYFMRSLLEEAGIVAYPALVNAGSGKNWEANADFAYPMFNHVILNIPSENYWLECTSSDNPPNYLGTFTDDRNVLLITEKGGVFSKTPATPVEDNLSQNKAIIQLDSKGAATVNNQATFTGTQQEYYRGLEKNASKEDIKKYFSKIVDLPSFQLGDYQLTSSADEPRAEFSYEVTLPRYGSKAGKRLFLSLNLINPMTSIPTKTEKRKFAVRIKRGYMEQDEFKYILPDGTTIESIPEKKSSVTSDFGTYEMSIEQDKNEITYKRTLKIFPLTAPAERYEEWRDFCKEVAKLDRMKVVLIQEKT